jgi:hypothetical protein
MDDEHATRLRHDPSRKCFDEGGRDDDTSPHMSPARPTLGIVATVDEANELIPSGGNGAA